MHFGPPPLFGVRISLNYNGNQVRWKLGWTNVRCSCLNQSVGKQNPAYCDFWWTDWAAEVTKWRSERTRSRRNAELAGTHPYPSSGCYERWQLQNLTNFWCFWLWNSCKIVFRTGLYHIINTEPDVHRIFEVVLASGLHGRVPLEAFAPSWHLSVWPAVQYELEYAMRIWFSL